MSNFTLESEAFDNGGVIPRKYGYKNGNQSPPLKISGVPENTLSLALIMDDPDAMGVAGKVWVHWVLWNIKPDVVELKENSIPSDCLEGETDFGEISYGGPAPPDKEHTYIFKLYALDQKLGVDKGSTKKQIEEAMMNHIIAETRLEGKYSP
ncbi:MAG: YbhB/YbcL family Raf kinase inhibitor-like protein [Thaumarchaeota archaeon]|nr:YbhB/YbcL family Raf kinase inhibitor-like protein [Nitrososphaerota archaeon]